MQPDAVDGTTWDSAHEVDAERCALLDQVTGERGRGCAREPGQGWPAL